MKAFVRSVPYLRPFALALLVAVAGVGAHRADAKRPAPTPAPSATPSPIPAPTPVPFAQRILRLHDTLAALAHTAPGTLGIAVFDPANDVHVAIHGERAFALASTSTLAIALVVYHLADERKLNLDVMVPISASDIHGSTSPLARRYPRGGASLPLWQLMRAMIVDGDSTATDLVVRVIGGQAEIQDALDALMLAGFSAHTTAAAPFAGTPEGVAALLSGVTNLRLLSLNTTSEFLLALGQAHADDTRLRAGFPDRARFAHLSATSDPHDGVTAITNDAGVLELPDRHRIVIVAFLADSTADLATREALLAEVGRAVYAAYVPAPVP